MKIKHQKLKSAGAFLTILLLLPYVVTVFVNGIDVLGMSQEPCVQAETEDQDGEKTVRTVPWTEYMMGILGKTMPASYEKEALKAQAVVLRTMLYQQAAQDVVFKEAYLTPEELKKKWGAENFENYYKKLGRCWMKQRHKCFFIRILMPGFRIINPVTERQEAEKK